MYVRVCIYIYIYIYIQAQSIPVYKRCLLEVPRTAASVSKTWSMPCRHRRTVNFDGLWAVSVDDSQGGTSNSTRRGIPYLSNVVDQFDGTALDIPRRKPALILPSGAVVLCSLGSITYCVFLEDTAVIHYHQDHCPNRHYPSSCC